MKTGRKSTFYNITMSTRVLLVSRGMFHDGLVRVLKNHAEDVVISGSAESWQEAKAMLNTLKPEALMAEYQFAEEILADLEQLAANQYFPEKILFIIQDENKIVVYQRQQLNDITIEHLIEAL